MSLVFKELGVLVDFKGGGTPSRNVEEYWANSIPWATVKDLNEGITLTETQEFISELGLKNSASNLITKGTIIIPTRMALGKVVISEIDVAINQDLKAVFVKDKEKLDVKYLLRFLESNKENIVSMGKGATVKGITLDQLKAIKIPLPPLAEQRRIASILDQADELRQKRQQAIEKLDQLLQATFIDMFGDPVSNPKGWEKKKIKQVLTKLTDGTHHSPPAMDEGIPYITAKHIKEGFIDFYSKPTFVSIEDHKAIYSRCDPIQGDVLYIKDGATTGIASINYFDFEFSLLSSVALLRPNPKLLTSDYLESWLNHKTVKQNILQNMGGAAIKRLTLAKIKDLDILVPNLENQNIFSKVKRQIYIQRQILERSFNIQNDLFQSLQNQAFNGTL